MRQKLIWHLHLLTHLSAGVINDSITLCFRYAIHLILRTSFFPTCHVTIFTIHIRNKITNSHPNVRIVPPSSLPL